MAKQYRRKESGLLVPGNDSIELPKIQPPRPWYARGILWPTARYMGRRRCCCQEEESSSSSSSSGIEVLCDDSGVLQDADCDFVGKQELSVDLGIGGWTNGDCDTCEDINGVFIVQRGQFNVCVWQYGFGIAWCTGGAELRIFCGIGKGVSPCPLVPHNRWWVQVIVTGVIPSVACYHNTNTIENGADCFSVFTDGVLVMTKVSDTATFRCFGSLPATVTISI